MKKFVVLLLLAVMPVSEVLAKQDYTYVKSSLVFPWFMFFVFFALILIPFVIVITLAWRNKTSAGSDEASDTVQSQPSIAISTSREKGLFNRFVLPAILVGVAIFSILLVLNAYEAMDLMEQFGTAAPTMLNARP